MNIKRLAIFLCATIVALFSLQTVFAAGEIELVLQKQFTSVQPIFMEGHEGDMNRIAGFNADGNITIGGSPFGTVSVQVLLLNPPMRLSEVHEQVAMQVTNTLTGLGSFDVTAVGLASGSSTTVTAGDLLVSWAGSISNGTGSLADVQGQSAGVGTTNVMTGQTELTEVLRIRFGF